MAADVPGSNAKFTKFTAGKPPPEADQKFFSRRVPLIVRWPGRIKAGTTSDLPCCFPDVLPTLAELAGVSGEVPNDIDGVSLVPTLLGEKAAGRPQQQHVYLFWEHGGTRAARMGKWKAIGKGDSLKLFDLSVDLGEIDIGRPSRAVPVTPPGIRVRTTAVRLVKRVWVR